MDLKDKWLRGFALVVVVAGAAGLSAVILEAPTAVAFALSVGLAFGWCYWLDRRSGVS